MWVNNWNADDTFPVCQVKWFQTGDKFCDRNHDDTWNNGYNTETGLPPLTVMVGLGITIGDYRRLMN